MIGDTNASKSGGGGGNNTSSYETANINLSTDQPSSDVLIGSIFEIQYRGEFEFSTKAAWTGTTVSRDILSGMRYAVVGGNVAGYITPDDVEYTSEKDNIRNINLQYKKANIKITATTKKGSFVGGVVKVLKNDAELTKFTIDSGSSVYLLLPSNATDTYKIVPEKVGEYKSKIVEFKANAIPEEVILEYSTAGYEINLNGQWQKSDKPNPDPKLYEGVYQSFSNKGVDSTKDTMIVTFEGMPNFELYIRSYAESNFDYVFVGKLDDENPDENNYQERTYGKQNSGTDLNSYIKVTYPNDGNKHFVKIVYRKDGSGASGDDRGYVFWKKPV